MLTTRGIFWFLRIYKISWLNCVVGFLLIIMPSQNMHFRYAGILFLKYSKEKYRNLSIILCKQKKYHPSKAISIIPEIYNIIVKISK